MKRFFQVNGALAVLALLMLPSAAQASSFPDVDENTPYAEAIEWMADNGVINGYENGNFGPNDPVRRQDFLTILYRAMQLNTELYSESQLTFSDVEDDAYYTDYVRAAASRETVEGYPDGTFGVGRSVTRAEAIKMAVYELNEGDIPEYKSGIGLLLPDDVNGSDWFAELIDYALWVDIVGDEHMQVNVDTEESFFMPNEAMTRKEVAELVYRLISMRDNQDTHYQSWHNPYPLEGNLLSQSCTYEDFARSQAPEDFFPSDAELMLAVDHSHQEQLENWAGIVEQFPDAGLMTQLIEEFNDDTREDLSYENTLEPVVEGDWRLMFGLGDFEFFDDYETSELEVYFAAYVEEADLFEQWLAMELQKDMGSNLTCLETSRGPAWASDWDDFYYARRGNLFVLTTSESNLQAALGRLESGNGFRLDYDQTELAYVYLDIQALLESDAIWEEIEYESGLTAEDLYLDEMDSVYMSLSAEESALSMNVWTGLNDNGEDLLSLYGANRSSATSALPGDGLVYLTEVPGLEHSFRILQVALEEEGMDFGAGWTELLALQPLLDNTLSLGVYNTGELVPSFILAIDLEGEMNLADNLESILDEFAEDYREELEELEEETGLAFSYAVDVDQNLFRISFHEDIQAAWGNSYLGDNTQFAEAEAMLPAGASQLNFLDFDELGRWLNVLEIEMGDDAGGEWNIMRQVLDTMSTFAMGSVLEGNQIHSEGRLQFNN